MNKKKFQRAPYGHYKWITPNQEEFLFETRMYSIYVAGKIDNRSYLKKVWKEHRNRAGVTGTNGGPYGIFGTTDYHEKSVRRGRFDVGPPISNEDIIISGFPYSSLDNYKLLGIESFKKFIDNLEDLENNKS